MSEEREKERPRLSVEFWQAWHNLADAGQVDEAEERYRYNAYRAWLRAGMMPEPAPFILAWLAERGGP